MSVLDLHVPKPVCTQISPLRTEQDTVAMTASARTLTPVKVSSTTESIPSSMTGNAIAMAGMVMIGTALTLPLGV